MQILSTKLLSVQDVNYAESIGLEIHSIPFITIEPVAITEVVKQYFQVRAYDSFVITSLNAANFLQTLISEVKINLPKAIYAVGPKTTTPLIGLDDIIFYPQDQNAKSLSRFILSRTNVTHCCYLKGNISLGTIEANLFKGGVKVDSYVCYNTKYLHQEISMKRYEGIMFYSPSAVDSFVKSGNEIGRRTIFVIGNTTALAVKKKIKKDAVVAPCANTKSLIETVKTYFDETK